ncbi:MBL fold metallo-hydrolase [Bacillus sp. UNCCL81]|uniref:MBL fold metallo-hydrolase n=1 Tax=Bacillus sp. UNCCL81 TaxID=1502755 RepID=UPI0008EFEC18|nr:MBL fold metallo-hydrolase [Bacillus sp. UNCCL81]SFC34225.1 Glyoxylase, beta-lactamase superfamily II [Bacillus sp. UNCCL81]
MLGKSKIQMLSITLNSNGMTNTIHPTLIWDEEDVVLIDTGYPGQLNEFQNCFETFGVPFEKLNKILFTHQDIDHIGSLSVIVEESTNEIEVYASEIEKPYIQGEKLLIKITPEKIAKAVASLPADTTDDFRKAFKNRLENPPKGKVNHIVTPGNDLTICGGITVIDTAGHTPGHISFYHKESKTLVAGDALIIENDQLNPSNPQYTYDIEQSIKSLEALLSFDIEKVICYHGGLFEGNIKERLSEIIRLKF